jgi:hypothetical protein
MARSIYQTQYSTSTTIFTANTAGGTDGRPFGAVEIIFAAGDGDGWCRVEPTDQGEWVKVEKGDSRTLATFSGSRINTIEVKPDSGTTTVTMRPIA